VCWAQHRLPGVRRGQSALLGDTQARQAGELDATQPAQAWRWKLLTCTNHAALPPRTQHRPLPRATPSHPGLNFPGCGGAWSLAMGSSAPDPGSATPERNRLSSVSRDRGSGHAGEKPSL